MSSMVHQQIPGLEIIEAGLKTLKNSKLMGQSQFKDMYWDIERHHRDLRLAHLTGKEKDLVEYAQKDTKFYNILTKMLCEVKERNVKEQRDSLQRVFTWYQANKHKLYSSPHFGKTYKKQAAEDILRKSSSPVSSAVSRRSRRSSSAKPDVTAVSNDLLESTQDEDEKLENGFDPDMVEFWPSPRFSNGETYSEPVESDDVREGNTVIDSDRVMSSDRFSSLQQGGASHSAQTPSGVPQDQSVQSTRQPALKKMLHPFTSLNNPHARIGLKDKSKSRETKSAGYRPVTGSSLGQGVHGKSKTQILQEWTNFTKKFSYGQDMINKMNYVGRSGTGFDVRYTAHARGETPETFTQDIIAHYAASAANRDNADEENQNMNMLLQQSLEEFYQTTENYYPHQHPKHTLLQKPKSAPINRKPKITANKGPSKLAQEEEKKEKQEKHSPPTNLRIDTMYKIIDDVTEGMTFYKERNPLNVTGKKLAPEPNPGFRQPCATGIPTTPPSTARRQRQIIYHDTSPMRRSVSPVVQMVNRERRPVTAHSILMSTSSDSSESPQYKTSVAIDWRGKISPDSQRYKWAKTKFGGHTYMKNLRRPTLRSAGGPSGGGRPRTAPMSFREKWKIEKKPEQPSPVAQAASHNTRMVDQTEVDSMMTVQHLLGSDGGVPRYFRLRQESLDSLYDMDEDFFRSVRRFSPTATGTSPPLEYVSIIAPTGSRVQSSKSVGRDGQQSRSSSHIGPGIDTQVLGQLSEYNRETQQTDAHFDQLTVSGSTGGADIQDIADLESELQALQDGSERAVQTGETEIQEGEFKEDDDRGERKEEEGEDRTKEQIAEGEEESLQDKYDVSHEEEKQKDELHLELDEKEVKVEDEEVCIEVTAIPSGGRAPLPAALRDKPLQPLTQSNLWHFSTDIEGEPEPRASTSLPRRPATSPTKREFTALHLERIDLDADAKMTSMKVERSAGRMPGRVYSANMQMMRLARRQNEHFQRTPPIRTPPSIPTPYNPYGGRSPRSGQVYSSELEHQARKEKSPRHYMDKVKGLRTTEGIRSAPPPLSSRDNLLADTLQVSGLKQLGRSHTMPIGTEAGTIQSILKTSTSDLELSKMDAVQIGEERPGELEKQVTFAASEDIPEETEEELTITASGSKIPTSRPRTEPAAKVPLARLGRPIAQVSHVPDPDELAQAVQRQKEAAAAVDIQRIFRGFVARNVYKKLCSEIRAQLEDERRAAVEIQRRFRGHFIRKTAIYNRAPDPRVMEWAIEYKKILMQKAVEREQKMNAISRGNSIKQNEASSKISVIGPHVDIYQIYHPKRTGPSKKELQLAATDIQRHIRGWLVRRKMDKLARKAAWQGSTFQKMVKEYKSTLARVQTQHGVEKPTLPFSFKEMNDFMDVRRRYETVFEKRAFGGELEMGDLDQFFKECDLYPSKAEVEEAMDVVLRGQGLKKGRGLKKKEVLDIVFYIYVPPATKLEGTRQSTWMNPIIDGVEARRLLGSEFVEDAPLEPCAQLVIKSKRERRMREEAERRQAQSEAEGAEDDNSEKGSQRSIGKKPSKKVVVQSPQSDK